MKTTSQKKILKNTTSFKLLGVFLRNPSKQFYESEIKRKSGLSAGAVNKHMKFLVEDNLVNIEKRGKMKFYRLNKDDLFVRRMKIAYNLSLPIIDKIKIIGKKLGVQIYLFGSVARGEDLEDSDYDILIIGQEKRNLIEREFNKIRKGFDKKIKILVFTKRDWIKMRKNDPAFYERVEKDKIELV